MSSARAPGAHRDTDRGSEGGSARPGGRPGRRSCRQDGVPPDPRGFGTATANLSAAPRHPVRPGAGPVTGSALPVRRRPEKIVGRRRRWMLCWRVVVAYGHPLSPLWRPALDREPIPIAWRGGPRADRSKAPPPPAASSPAGTGPDRVPPRRRAWRAPNHRTSRRPRSRPSSRRVAPRPAPHTLRAATAGYRAPAPPADGPDPPCTTPSVPPSAPASGR